MAKSAELKIAEDIEYRVIGNALGVLIASAGLLAGEMARMKSLDYWVDDIVPLLLMMWMSFRLYRNFISTMVAYESTPAPPVRPQTPSPSQQHEGKEAVKQIGSKPDVSVEKVVEAVAKRIEAKKTEAAKKKGQDR